MLETLGSRMADTSEELADTAALAGSQGAVHVELEVEPEDDIRRRWYLSSFAVESEDKCVQSSREHLLLPHNLCLAILDLFIFTG